MFQLRVTKYPLRKMFLQNFVLIFLLNHNVINIFCFIDVGNVFHHLNKEANDMATCRDTVVTRWIEQDLDHFDTNEQRKWKMKYFERLDFWKPDGPIFLFVGGESKVSSSWATTGTTYELAKETNGAIIISEHRYYGDSKPFNKTDAESFKFLSSRQALADLEKLLLYIKKQTDFEKSKVVVIGGSYAGNLAAWMKLLYPKLVNAVIASSGPVLAIKDFYGYIEKVNDNYELYGTPDCMDGIRKTFKRYEKLLQTPEGIHQLKEEENICEDSNLMLPVNQQIFFMTKVGEFMGNSQYGNVVTIKNHCKNLNNTLHKTRDTLIPNFWFERKECFYYDFNEMIKEYHKEEYDWILAWVYQTCTEFGYFQTTNSEDHPFTKNIPLDFYINTCIALFGPEFNEKRVDDGVKEANELYGGLNPNVTNVVFTNGDMDPWSMLSILEDLSYEAPAVVIPRSSHCRDLFSNRKGDVEELKEARKHIKYLIKNWLGAGDYLRS